MPYLSTQTVTRRFPVSDLSGAAVDADSTPVGVLIKNGTALGTTVTVTHIATGKYSASFVLPTVSAGDTFELEVTAVVGGTTLAPFYWFIDAGVTTASLVVAPPTANEVAAAVLDLADAVETGWTLRKVLRVLSAALAGLSSNGGKTFRAIDNSKVRITSTVDASRNRTSVTLDAD